MLTGFADVSEVGRGSSGCLPDFCCDTVHTERYGLTDDQVRGLAAMRRVTEEWTK